MRVAPARLALGIQILENRLPLAVLDGPHVGANQFGIGMHKQLIAIAEGADVTVLTVAQLRQPPRHIALGLVHGHPLAHALLAVTHDARRQVQNMAQLCLALGHHLGTAFPGAPCAQGQHCGANREHKPQQLSAQAGIFHSPSYL